MANPTGGLPGCRGCRGDNSGEDLCTGCIAGQQEPPRSFDLIGKRHRDSEGRFKRGRHGTYVNKEFPRLKVALVGNANVGKSVIFNALTRQYVTVSNYPGTSVEVIRGEIEHGACRWEIVDTPGMYSLMPLSEDERVARQILLREPLDVVVHVFQEPVRNYYQIEQLWADAPVTKY